MADTGSSVAIIIVTYNSREEIDACLDSLVGHTKPFHATITVVDNASRDGTVAFVREKFPSVQVNEAGDNLGFSKANNLGIRATKSDYVVILNPDTVTPPGGMQALVRGLASNLDAAIAGARLLSDRGFPELSWGPPISPWSEFKQMVLGGLYRQKIRRIVRKIDKLSRQPRKVAWVSGACMAIRRPDLEAVGLFDERYFMYREDVDLCLAMHKRGRDILYMAPAEVLHLRGKSAAKNPQVETRRGQSHLAYYQKHLPMWAPVLKIYLTLRGRL